MEWFVRAMALVMVAVLTSCGGSPSSGDDDDISATDARGDAATAIDASPTDTPVDAPTFCPVLGDTCESDGYGIYHCTIIGMPRTYEACSAGCVASPAPHCGTLRPTGVLTVDDLRWTSSLGAITVPASGTVVDTETGEMSGLRGAGTGIIAGIDFQVRQGVGVFRVRKLTIDGEMDVIGANAVAFAVAEDIQVHQLIDATGECIGSAPGPGGAAGGAPRSAGSGSGAGLPGGAVGTDRASGGGGGSYASRGGDGGNSDLVGGPMIAGGPAGGTWGSAEITQLIGGSGGGGGGGDSAGAGGGGGGAVQLAANREIRFQGVGQSSPAGIRAHGCGGKGPLQTVIAGGGGGGGSGGAVLLESPRIFVASNDTWITVAGGGGGAFSGGSGSDGRHWLGGFPGGGDGGSRDFAGQTLAGKNGDSSGAVGAGGGGGVGRIRFNVMRQDWFAPGNVVPSPTDAQTTATIGVATSE